MNIPESELITTGLPADVAKSALFAEHKKPEFIVTESLLSDVGKVELGTCSACDQCNDSVADRGSISQSTLKLICTQISLPDLARIIQLNLNMRTKLTAYL